MYRSLFALPLLCLLLPAVAAADEELNEKIETCIRRLSPDTKVEIRRESASELAPLGADAKSAIPALRKALEKDTDAKVRRLSAYAIKQMGDAGKSALPAIIAALKADKDDDVRAICANVCAQHGKEAKAAVPALAAALKNPEVGPHAAVALSEDGRRGEAGPKGADRSSPGEGGAVARSEGVGRTGRAGTAGADEGGTGGH